MFPRGGNMELKPINQIAQKLGIPEANLEYYGRYKAKIDYRNLLKDRRGKLIMVTAMTPTPAGEGKLPQLSV
jgi:Formyltetrahydrofolate synthetase